METGVYIDNRSTEQMYDYESEVQALRRRVKELEAENRILRESSNVGWPCSKCGVFLTGDVHTCREAELERAR